jgi:HEAT repeat protein
MSEFKDWQTPDLLEEASRLSHEDAESDLRDGSVHELHCRGTEDIFEAAKFRCDSDDFIERELAADILAQLGALSRKGEEPFPFTKQSVPLLERLLDDPEPRVIASALYAMGWHDAYDKILEKPHLTSHKCVWVRQALSFALGGATSPPAIEMLIKLSQDDDDDVRNWATFGLGTQCSLDTSEIREALFQRLDDAHSETSEEAFTGLVRRRDQRVIPYIAAALAGDSANEYTTEAAGIIAAPELVGPLEKLCSWWSKDTELLQSALRRCKGQSTPDDESRWNSLRDVYY